MDEVANSPDVANMYTKYSHHHNYSVIVLTQNKTLPLRSTIAVYEAGYK